MTAKFFAASAASLLFATVVHAAILGPIVIGVPVGLSVVSSVVAPSVVQEGETRRRRDQRRWRRARPKAAA